MIETDCALNKPENANGSCLDKDHLRMIAEHAPTISEPIVSIQTLKEETRCDSDKCVIEKINIPIEVKEQIKREALKTNAESLDGNYWINNTEIDTCMSQLRKQYPGFAHTFIHMSDLKSFPPSNLKSYDYTVKSLVELDLAECIKRALNKEPCCQGLSTYNDVPLTSIGVVFNTDTSKGSGQHWFAVYISWDTPDSESDNKKKVVIEVFNSGGTDIDSKIFQEYWEAQRLKIAKATGLRCEYNLVSTIPHQRDDTGNCGSYSLFYIYSRLRGIKPERFDNIKKKITDSEMEKFRSVLFQV